jgi:hypothetical protein
MIVFPLFLEAAGQVAVIALILGAGLPALFALGVRSFALAGAGDPRDTDVPRDATSLPAPLLRTLGVVCFLVVVAAVVLGLTIIIATGFGQEVSFENVFPTFVPKD